MLVLVLLLALMLVRASNHSHAGILWCHIVRVIVYKVYRVTVVCVDHVVLQSHVLQSNDHNVTE
jgi:hypothetical protein